MTTHAAKFDDVAGYAPQTSGSTILLNPASSAFALSAAIAIVFNTLLTWGKEAYPALNAFMASLSGHHWITHGLADVAVFIALGLVFMTFGTASQMSPKQLVAVLVSAVFSAGLGLAAWFVLG
ncbi:MAG: hypothetical protein JWO05_1652 [Gemmatimonadetes bacterium]|nr:hypothetical protein [Gemmatimonadota bacterium]